MADAKITISCEDLASAVIDAVNQKIKETGEASEASASKGGALKKYLEDLVPSTNNAHKSFSDLKGTLTEMWENPTGQIKALAAAAGEDLAPALGSVGLAAGGAIGVLAALSGIAFELAKNAAEAGEAIYQGSLKTGMSTEAYSRLSNALTVIGSDVGQVSNAMFTFEKNVGENSAKVAEGLGKIGLTLDGIKRLEPDQQFLAIAEAIGKTEDPTLRNAAAAELFGQRLARNLMPTLMDVNEGLKKTAGMEVFTPEQAHEAKEFEENWRLLKTQIEQLAIAFGKDLLPALNHTLEFIQEHKDDVKQFAESFVPAPIKMAADEYRWLADAFHVLHDESYGLPVTLEQIDAQTKKLHDSNAKLGSQAIPAVVDGLRTQAEVLGDLKAENAAHLKATEDADRAAAHWKGVLDELASVGADFHETLNGIDGETVAAVEYYLGAKVAQEKLAEAYGLTASQVKAVSDALKEEKDWLDEVEREHEVTVKLAMQHEKDWRDEQQRLLRQSNDDTARSIKETRNLWDDYYDRIAKESLSTTDYQRRQVQIWLQDEIAKLKDDDANWQQHYDALVALAQQRYNDIDRAAHPYFADVKTLLQDLRGDWIDHFGQVLVETRSWKDAAKAVYETFRSEVQKVLADMLGDFIHKFLDKMLEEFGGWAGKLVAKWVTTQTEMAAVSQAGGAVSGTAWWSAFVGALAGGGGGGSTNGPGTGGNADPFWWITGNGTNPGGGFPGMGGSSGSSGGDDQSGRGSGATNPPQHDAAGGVVYAAQGWPFPGRPQGTDTVPAWLTPGEGVLTRGTVDRLGGAGAVHALNHGGNPGLEAHTAALSGKLDALGRRIEQALERQPIMLRHALRGAW